ncbi:FliM/FliN family flagellar motor switch protein [Kiloniella laminariae]|uniref:Flagellar motor switch protein FliN n=1 Tax=Kiloniella laminariae TaxID=454162 RepID=A0ABT4LNJ4_9PROT|nr:FliM/FliN family flagellar motor switch protein [Kiloniella laminariae]MCZ4281896.1 FliM/FliN family flagellar motor switch protein [Kiloniella laminariae]
MPGEETTKNSVDDVRKNPSDTEPPAIHGVGLEVSAILGTAQMPVSQLLKMGRGAVVELDKYIGDTIDISINDQMIARGEVMIKDDRLCVEITEMIKRTGNKRQKKTAEKSANK